MSQHLWTLPETVKIHEKFLTGDAFLTIHDGNEKPLFNVDCPSLRLKKLAHVYSADADRDKVCSLSPVYGVNWNIMVSQPNDEILGVIQKEKSADDGQVFWVVLDANGKKLITIRRMDSGIQRLLKKLKPFSSQVFKFYSGKEYLGFFTKKSGVVHEEHVVQFEKNTFTKTDPRMILSACIALTGIFDRVFT